MPPATVVRVVLAVLCRPRLWAVAVRQALSLARPGWWRQAPFLPVPPAGYVRFRLVTAYGGAGDAGARSSASVADDVVAYLGWCRVWGDHGSASR